MIIILKNYELGYLTLSTIAAGAHGVAIEDTRRENAHKTIFGKYINKLRYGRDMSNWIAPWATNLWIKCRSMSICWIRAWNIGLTTMCRDDWLSQSTSREECSGIPSSHRK